MPSPTPTYIKSDNINHVFPCVSRSDSILESNRLSSKLLSEKNIVNIIKSITDEPSYIISHSPNQNNTLKFVLDGYYFEVKNFTLNEGNKYAQIAFKDTGDFQLINAEDSENNFLGLKIYSEPPTGSYLTLCVGGSIPPSSYIKFDADSLRINSIDCGVVY